MQKGVFELLPHGQKLPRFVLNWLPPTIKAFFALCLLIVMFILPFWGEGKIYPGKKEVFLDLHVSELFVLDKILHFKLFPN